VVFVKFIYKSKYNTKVKHLKLFESFGGEYEEVDRDQCIKFGVISIWKDTELNKIIKIMEKKGFLDWYTSSPDWYTSAKTIVFHKESIPRTRMGIKIEISSMEDEWFKVITTNMGSSIFDHSFMQYNHADRKYYLCDQFDGLLKLLNDKL
jgi:hypothetical protein